MGKKQMADRLLRFCSVLISAVLFIIPLSACNLRNGNEHVNEVSVEVNEVSMEESAAVDALPEESDTNTEDGTVRTNVTVDFFGEDAGSPKKFSLDLPAGWTSSPSGIFDREDRWIASLELHKVENIEQPFSDIDQLYDTVLSTEEFEVSGYPAKSYVIEPESDSNDIRLQYLYYIMFDDAYVLVFFSPEEPMDTAETDFKEIVSSIQLVQG